jgi:ketosteroid isomerase-like protein
MSNSENNQTQIKAFLQEFHSAIAHKNAQRLSELVVDDVFMFGAAANAVSVGESQLIMEFHSYFEQAKDIQFHIQSSETKIGLSDSGQSAWFFNQFFINVAGKKKECDVPIRFTGLLTLDSDWRLAAGYWSIPLRSNEYQYSLLQDVKIPLGIVLDSQVSPEAEALAQRLAESMQQPSLMPELYSTRDDAFTIGSTVDEVFFAADGKDFVQQITGLPLKFAIRGGVHGKVSADGCTAWMGTHIDIVGEITMPYRFFYVWLLEQGKWEIVVSHDAVSVDPFNSRFDFP